MPLTKPEKRARVLIVDDHPSVREALSIRIERQPDLEVCGQAEDVNEALALIDSTQPDVAVIDITLKTGSGIDLIKSVAARNLSVRMLVWSSHSESLYAERALQAGALGYVSKDQATDVIVAAIQRVLQGKLYLSEAMHQALVERRFGRAPNQGSRALLDCLSDRELEVFRLIGQGVKNTDIAKMLHIAAKTVETYRFRIREKLNLKDATALTHHATLWAVENGLA